jgi:PiT family inorganic phosphate transporter
MSVGALATDEDAPTVGDPELDGEDTSRDIGESSAEELPESSELFDPSTTVRVVAMQNLVPVVATVGSFLTFELVFFG